MYFMNTKGVEYSAAVTRKKAGGGGRPEADDFRRSRLNPRSQSRTLANKRSGHAPSVRVLDYARRSARALAQQALAPPAAWRLLEDADGGALLYERAVEFAAPDDTYAVRAVVTVDAAADDVLRLLDAPTTEALASAGPALFGTHFHAGVALNRLTCSSPTAAGARYTSDDAYAVLWLSLRCVSKLGAVENHRDTTAVSYQDVFDRGSLQRLGRSAARDKRGASSGIVAVHALVSTTLADVPPLPKSEATDRVHFRDSGVVVEPLSPGLCRVSMLLSLLPPDVKNGKKSGKTDRKTRKWLQSVAVTGVTALAKAVAAKFPPPKEQNAHGLALQPVAEAQWRASDHCYICLKTFRTFRRGHHCRFCGEAVCGTCSGHVDARSGRTVDSGDWANPHAASVDSGSSSGSGGGRDRTSSSDKASTLRACNACAYELEQRLSGAPSLPDPVRDSSSSNDSISLSLYSVDRDPAGGDDGGFSLELPDFDDVLGESAAANAAAPTGRRAPPPPPPPAYQFAMALQRGRLNAALPHMEQQPRKQWTSADSLGAAMRGLEQYHASLSTASSSLHSRSHASLGSDATASLSDAASLASLSLADAPASTTSATPSRFLDVTEHDPRQHQGVRYHFSSFSESADGSGANGSAARASAASSSFTDVSAAGEPQRNDMIPLAPPPIAARQFVVFPGAADAGAASVCSSTSSSAGGSSSRSDMIPLTLL